MTKLKFATDLSLPIEAVTQKFGFIGTSGSGKTYGASRLAESMWDAGAQFVVLDPVGVWYGLRLASDGEHPSNIRIPIFGGLHGDIPLEPTAGGQLADLIVDRGISAILDVSQFESDAAKARFAADFADRFFFRKKSKPSAVHVFIEECQEFIPEHQQRGEERMLHAFTRLQKIGRNFGIGVSLITQRPQEVAKKVLNLAQTLFVFRTTGAHERAAIDRWIKDKAIEGQDLSAELPKLKTGKPHIWSPEWLELSRVISVLEKRTYDASATPEVGVEAATRDLASIDLKQIQADMAETIERAKADDPKELRKKIAELERANKQLATQAPTKVDHATMVSQIDAAVNAARAQWTRELKTIVGKDLGLLAKAIDQVKATSDRLAGQAQDAVAAFLAVDGDLTSPTTPIASAARTAAAPVAAVRRPDPAPRPARAPKPAAGDSTIGGTPQRILNALLFLETVGTSPATRAAIAGLVGVSWDTGTFRTYLSELRSHGYIVDGPNTTVALSDEGRAQASDDGLPTTRRELHRAWKSKLGGTPAKMFDVLIEAYPDAVSRTDLGAACNIDATTGTFRTYLSELRSPGLITDPSKTEVRAADALFPEGLP